MAPRLTWPLVAIGSCAAIALLAFGAITSLGADDDSNSILDDAGNKRWDHPLVKRVWTLQDEIVATRIAASEDAAFREAYAALPDTPGVVLRELPIEVLQPGSEMDSSFVAEINAGRDSALRAYRSAVAARIGSDRPRSRIALVEVRSIEDAEYGPWWYVDAHPVRYFAGRDSAGGYCLGSYSGVRMMLEYNEPLGPCRLWLRFGAPSPAMLDWLAGAGHVLEFDTVQPPRREPTFAGPQFFFEPENTARRRLFGFRGYDEDIDYLGLGAQGCLAGREDRCLAAVLDPSEWRFRRAATEGAALQTRARYSALEIIGGLFGDIERAVGTSEFERIWRTSADPRADLEAALGADLDGWLMEWLREHLGPEPRGPIVPAGTLALALICVALLLGVSVVVAQRRHVG